MSTASPGGDAQGPEHDSPAIPSARPRLKKHNVTDDFAAPTAFRIGFIGLGQGGGRMAETFYKLGYRRVCAINSALSDLADLDPAICRLDLQAGGAGQDMQRGERVLRARELEVWDTLVRAIGEDADYLIVCASLGGGTGSGGAAPLLDICRRYMVQQCGQDPAKVGALVSLPNTYDGQRTCRNAVQAFREIGVRSPSPFLIVDNKRVEQLFASGALELYSICNGQIARLFHLFNTLAAQRSQLITFDRADFAALLDAGVVTLGASSIDSYETKADISEAIQRQLADTVLAEVDLRGGKAAGCIFQGSEQIMREVPLEYFGQGFSVLSRIMADDSAIYRGVYVGRTDDLRCYTMVGALPFPLTRLQELARAAGLPAAGGGMADYLGI